MIVASGGRNVSLRSIEDPIRPLTGEALVSYLGLDSTSYTGKTITQLGALTGTAAVYACVNLLAGTLGALPAQLYQRMANGNKDAIAPTIGRFPSSVARLIHHAPNPEMTAQESWEMAFAHDLLWGNYYGNVVRGPDGRPREVWPLRPDLTRPMRDSETGRKFYRTRLSSGQQLDLKCSEVMHVKALLIDGMCGVAPLKAALNAVGIEQAAAEYAGRFWQNSAIPGVALKGVKLGQPGSPGRDEKVRFLREQWQDMYGGLKRSHRMAILEDGVDIQTLGIPADQAQFMELRDFQITECARVYGIPPHMLGQTEKSTSYGQGIEQQAIGFVVFTCMAWLKRFEQAANRDLGFPADVPGQDSRTLLDEGYFVEFTVDGLLRGDSAARYASYAIGRQWGFLSRADVRRKENLPVADDGSDDGYLTPMNFVDSLQGVTPAQRELARAFLDRVGTVSTNGHGTLDPAELALPR